MVEGVGAPATLFRVFHGAPATDSQLLACRGDQVPTALAEGADGAFLATDLHLREFSQLEVRVKALELQAQPSAAPRGTANALAGALGECLRFYARLLTAESFVWPDFLAAVFTKLAEHFAASESAHVKGAVLEVFAFSPAHVAQVNDPTKLIATLTKLLDDGSLTPLARALTLRLLGTMPTLIQDDAAAQSLVLSALSATDETVKDAAVATARALLVVSQSFRNDAFPKLVRAQSVRTCSLLNVAASTPTDAQQAWAHCGNLLYKSLVDDKTAVSCLRTMTSLAKAHPVVLTDQHLQLLGHLLTNDPRKLVRNFALLVAQELVPAPDSPSIEATTDDRLSNRLAELCVAQLRASPSPLRMKLSALQLAHKLSLSQECDARSEFASQLISLARSLSQATSDARFIAAHCGILANVCCNAMNNTKEDADILSECTDELLAFLHPTLFNKSPRGWQETLSAVVRVAARASGPEVSSVNDHIVRRLVELIALLRGSDVNNAMAKTWILASLAALPVPSVEVVCDVASVLFQETEAVDADKDIQRLRSLARIVFKWSARGGDTSGAMALLEHRVLVDTRCFQSNADRYDIGKLAMLHGCFERARQLLEPITATLDHESYGAWITALVRVCEAEELVCARQEASLESVHCYVRAATYLNTAAATSTCFAYILQKRFVALRGEWMQLVLQAQQMAAEAAFTNSVVGNREPNLSARFAQLAQHFSEVKLRLLGADRKDLEALASHAALSALLSVAIDRLVLSEDSSSSGALYRLLPSQIASDNKIIGFLQQLERDVLAKAEKLGHLRSNGSGGIGATGARVLQQLLAAIAGVPCVLPPLFFRMQVRPERRVHSSAQFLTATESTTFTAKPRARSQLGVPFGTDFTCLLKGVVVCNAEMASTWRRSMAVVSVDVCVCFGDGKEANGADAAAKKGLDGSDRDDRDAIQHHIRADVSLDWDAISALAAQPGGSQLVHLPFQLPVHVQAEHLSTKGAFHLVSNLALVDRDGARWPLAASGGRRGFIVY